MKERRVRIPDEGEVWEHINCTGTVHHYVFTDGEMRSTPMMQQLNEALQLLENFDFSAVGFDPNPNIKEGSGRWLFTYENWKEYIRERLNQIEHSIGDIRQKLCENEHLS